MRIQVATLSILVILFLKPFSIERAFADLLMPLDGNFVDVSGAAVPVSIDPLAGGVEQYSFDVPPIQGAGYAGNRSLVLDGSTFYNIGGHGGPVPVNCCHPAVPANLRGSSANLDIRLDGSFTFMTHVKVPHGGTFDQVIAAKLHRGVSVATPRWILDLSGGSFRIIFAEGDSTYATDAGSPNANEYSGHTSISQFATSSPDHWQHIAFTWNQATQIRTTYLDGQLVEAGNLGPSFAPDGMDHFDLAGLGAGSMWIGGNVSNVGANTFFQGLVDELQLFQRALTQPEIAFFANNTFTPEPTSLATMALSVLMILRSRQRRWRRDNRRP